MEARIGISGWTYKPWRGIFYPEKLAQHRELEFASRQVNSIEINGSFYSLQRPSSYQKWFDSTPDDFCFAVKANRYITHIRRLKNIEKPLSNFFASGVLLLRQKLGPILWQFPPNFKFDALLFEKFLFRLPQTTKEAAALARGHEEFLKGRVYTRALTNAPLKHAVEIRNPTFDTPEYFNLLRKYGVASVIAETAGKWPYFENLTTDFIYIRLHGDRKLYVSGYTDVSLRRWARKIKNWGKKFGAKSVYVYFDNDVKVRAPYDAQRLLKLLTDFKPEHPMKKKDLPKVFQAVT